MSNDSLGPIQVYDATVFSINDAFRQIVERIDELKGLRGSLTIFGQTTYWNIPVRVVDADGHLIHAFGTTT